MTNKSLTIKELLPDSRRRISLKGLADDADSFKVEKLEDGSILLTPMVHIPQRELWLYKNPVALQKVENGIDQIQQDNERHYLGDFTKYIDENDDE